MIKVLNFEAIADIYRDTLVLGNGSSIALDPCFSYRSLLGKAVEEKLITEDVQTVFDYLKSSDFELVMRMLRHAFKVNQALGIDERRTARAYGDLRAALIRSVRATHVLHEKVVSHFDA